jgi:hypothetical protein
LTSRLTGFRDDIPHYYHFESLVKGKKVITVSVTVEPPLGVSYDPAQRIVIDERTDVILMANNPPSIDLSYADHA